MLTVPALVLKLGGSVQGLHASPADYSTDSGTVPAEVGS